MHLEPRHGAAEYSLVFHAFSIPNTYDIAPPVDFSDICELFADLVNIQSGLGNNTKKLTEATSLIRISAGIPSSYSFRKITSDLCSSHLDKLTLLHIDG